MNPPSFDIYNKLLSLGAVTAGRVFIGADPLNVPETFLTISDTAGSANPRWLRDAPRIQVRCRGARDSYAEAYAAIRKVKDALLGIQPWTVGTAIYTRCVLTSDIMFLGYDPDNRPVFSINFELGVDYTSSTGTNRDVIA